MTIEIERSKPASGCDYCKNISVCAICGKGYAEAIRKNTAELPRWIPVSERLPKDGEEIIGLKWPNRVWSEEWDSTEPSGMMTHWIYPPGESAGEAPTNETAPASASASVSLLSDDALSELWDAIGDAQHTTWAAAVQRKFCEVNGLKLAAISATTKEN